MALQDDIQGDLLAVHYGAGSYRYLVTYAGTPNVPAQVKFGEDKDEVSGTLYAVAEIAVLKSDVPAATYRDIIVINGVSWRVRHIMKGNYFSHYLKLYSDEKPLW